MAPDFWIQFMALFTCVVDLGLGHLFLVMVLLGHQMKIVQFMRRSTLTRIVTSIVPPSLCYMSPLQPSGRLPIRQSRQLPKAQHGAETHNFNVKNLSGRDRLGLGIRIADLNQIADLKLSILAPVKFRLPI